MARLALNKASLSKQSRQLKTFERFLPSLDLKRQQLMAEQARERIAIARTRQDMEALRANVAAQMPMLANREVDLSELVKVKSASLGEHNVVGTRLPTLESVEVQVRDYGYLAKPHWVDRLVVELTRMLELQLKLAVQQRRAELLDDAARKVTQRVNLFEKVLIPRAEENIRKIRIYLADAERAAVVRSKIAKRNRAAQGVTT
jgi:V/A-type H+/Na+-transporting ATPase subunit D